MKKLSPKINFGCMKCKKKEDELDIELSTDIKLSDFKDSSKVISLTPAKRQTSSKVISLF